jgi:hypothetical protein
MMIAYIVIIALCGVVVVQGFLYRRERVKLYSMVQANPRPAGHPLSKGGKKQENGKGGHKRALLKWRNGGDDS